jgi:ABC-type phosphate transport system ATPase subunit
MAQEELTSKVAMLSQEPPLLPVSIRDNIAYGLKPGGWVVRLIGIIVWESGNY